MTRILEVFSGDPDGKISFTRTSSAIVLTAILAVFLWAAWRDNWETVRSIADALMLLVFALFGITKAPTIASAIKAKAR